MNTLRTRPAAGTGVRLAHMPDGDHGRRAVTDSARYLKAMRDEGGWSKGLLHHVDSLVKPTRAGAHTSSKLSQSLFCTPIQGPFCEPIDNGPRAVQCLDLPNTLMNSQVGPMGDFMRVMQRSKVQAARRQVRAFKFLVRESALLIRHDEASI